MQLPIPSAALNSAPSHAERAADFLHGLQKTASSRADPSSPLRGFAEASAA
jgi:hypothetical protein